MAASSSRTNPATALHHYRGLNCYRLGLTDANHHSWAGRRRSEPVSAHVKRRLQLLTG